MSHPLVSHRTRTLAARQLAALSLAVGLALAVLVLGISLQPGAAAMPDKVTLATSPVITQTYVIFASGPSANLHSIHETGSNLTLIGGGLYGGDGGRFNNVTVLGDPPPPVDVVPPCFGCQVSGTTPNFNATPLVPPILYDVSDFSPGGQYAQESGWFPGCVAPDGCGNYHYYTSTVSFSGTLLNGLYYMEGDVGIHDVTGTASIVTPGYIQISGSAVLTTFDQRFPLLFTTAPDIGSGAISFTNLFLALNGNLYAPNGRVIFSGVAGAIAGLVYAQEIALTGSQMTITCPICNFSTLSLRKAVTPTTDIPYHGVVTYTIALRNLHVLIDTSALVTDTLPAGVTFGQWLGQPADGVIQNGDAITWTGELSASTGITFIFTATHTGDYGDVITNTAYFSGAAHTGSDSATFTVTPIHYTLTITTAGNGDGIVTPTVGMHQYPSNTVVALQATPYVSSTFAGWSGDAGCAHGTVTMDADKSCTATFVTYHTYLPIVLK